VATSPLADIKALLARMETQSEQEDAANADEQKRRDATVNTLLTEISTALAEILATLEGSPRHVKPPEDYTGLGTAISDALSKGLSSLVIPAPVVQVAPPAATTPTIEVHTPPPAAWSELRIDFHKATRGGSIESATVTKR
jgi:hypothetical protein